MDQDLGGEIFLEHCFNIPVLHGSENLSIGMKFNIEGVSEGRSLQGHLHGDLSLFTPLALVLLTDDNMTFDFSGLGFFTSSQGSSHRDRDGRSLLQLVQDLTEEGPGYLLLLAELVNLFADSIDFLGGFTFLLKLFNAKVLLLSANLSFRLALKSLGVELLPLLLLLLLLLLMLLEDLLLSLDLLVLSQNLLLLLLVVGLFFLTLFRNVSVNIRNLSLQFFLAGRDLSVGNKFRTDFLKLLVLRLSKLLDESLNILLSLLGHAKSNKEVQLLSFRVSGVVHDADGGSS